jgi:hypothetical protein
MDHDHHVSVALEPVAIAVLCVSFRGSTGITGNR